MRRDAVGDYVTISTAGDETARAFVPAPLPPAPPLAIDAALRSRLDKAQLALGRLDGVSGLLPSPELFLYPYVRKEALLSSQIEGTRSSLSDLLLFELDETPGVPIDDVTEVSNYVAALDHGLARIRGGFPLSNRLLREIHGVLLRSGRGTTKDPGEFRRSQNWLGGTRPSDAAFVPPPPDRVADAMGALERWLHESPEPTLLKAALAHVQFETIHPFLDGNGRVGRLLITLLFCVDGVLQEPLLYLSLYFKQRRPEYYEHLRRVRTDGDWEGWVAFFADGVRETADGAAAAAKRLVALFRDDQPRVEGIGRGATSALKIYGALQRRPLRTIANLAAETGYAVPTVTAALAALGRLNIAREVTGRRRNRVFGYGPYLDILSEGTEPL